ncbi:MAG: hypothetical protein LBF08_05490 [Dysgonamonadaceae bacterium]|jgi:hypothetical protein|nr:hypothetical protein [Dysgonamonadaceae bacterium]
MVVISPTELRAEQKKYLDLAEKEDVVIKRGQKLIHLVVKERTITDEDLRRGITGEELKRRMHKRIDKLFDK